MVSNSKDQVSDVVKRFGVPRQLPLVLFVLGAFCLVLVYYFEAEKIFLIGGILLGADLLLLSALASPLRPSASARDGRPGSSDGAVRPEFNLQAYAVFLSKR